METETKNLETELDKNLEIVVCGDKCQNQAGTKLCHFQVRFWEQDGSLFCFPNIHCPIYNMEPGKYEMTSQVQIKKTEDFD